jgi:signal peptide peptidase SppA
MRPDLLLRLLAEETGERLFALDLAAAAGWQAREPGSAAPKAPDKIAIIPFHGVQTANGMRFMGRQYTPGMNTFRQALAGAAANPEVGAVVIDMDSPGGTVAGTPETAAAVAQANGVKPVVAMVDTVCASAAYWVASQCSQIWAQPSAELGSIGVQGTHVDMSGALDQAGLKATIVRSKNAPFKNEANPFEPLSEEALAALQASADEAEDGMFAAIAGGRKVAADKARADFGKGRMMSAARARDAGMLDRVGTMAELLGSLRTQTGAVRRRFSALAFD